MSVREYIGARYVPLFMGQWSEEKEYEPLSVVQYQGNSYTSRQSVPTGIPLTNETYWAETGNYNAQIEAYRQEVHQFDDRIVANSDVIQQYGEELAAEIQNREAADSSLDNTLTQRINSKKITTVTDPLIIYVANISGNDSNAGTQTAPVKTIQAALDIIESKTISGNIYIIERGVYYILGGTIVGGQKHIIAQAPNIEIRWDDDTNDNTNAFYGGYLNLTGYVTQNNDERTKFVIKGSLPAYLEGCKASIANVDIYSDSRFGFIGCGATCDNVRFYCPIFASLANVVFGDCEFYPDYNGFITEYGVSAYNNSNITLSGACKIQYNGNNLSSAIFRIAGASQYYVRGSYPITGTMPIIGYLFEECTLIGTSARISTLLGRNYTTVRQITISPVFDSIFNKYLLAEDAEIGVQITTNNLLAYYLVVIRFDSTYTKTVILPKTNVTIDHDIILKPNGDKVRITTFASGNIRYTNNPQSTAEKVTFYAIY